jgi:acetyl esterase
MTTPALHTRFPGLDPDIARLLEAARAAGLPPLTELEPTQLRARVSAGDALGGDGPALAEVADDVVAGIRVRRYRPDAARTRTVIVWFHGGGWTTGDLNYSDGFCRRLAAGTGAIVQSVDYRLAPEHPFPAAVDDAMTAVRAIAGTGPVVVAGDSAGGNLAAVCAQQLQTEVALHAQLLVYPTLDTDVTRASYRRNDGLVLGPREMEWFFDQYVPDRADRTAPRVAPLRAASVRGLAPAVVAVAGLDPLYDEGLAYADRLRSADVPVTVLDFPSLVHGFLRYTVPAPAAAAAAEQIVAAAAQLF